VTYYSQGSGNWSTVANWNDQAGGGGSSPADMAAMDGQDCVIQASHNILMDADLSALTGLGNVTVTGGATPGMLYFANGTNGYLKIRAGKTLSGTTSTNRGRLLANSDGSWSTSTALQDSNTAVIDLQTTAYIDAANLDIRLYCTQPTNEYVETYGYAHTCTQSTGVNTSTDVITFTRDTSTPTNGTTVRVKSSGTLPGGLDEDTIYYVRSVSGTDPFTCKLATQNSDARIVDITSVGSGTMTMYTSYSSGSTTVNVIQDVTSDTPWQTATGRNDVVLANVGPQAYDQQRVTLSTINSGSLVLSASVDSTQYPLALVSLASRNVAIRSSTTSSSGSIVTWGASTFTGSVLQCEIRSTAGTGTTFYGYGTNSGYGHTISGAVSGCNIGVAYGTSHTISGVVSGCSNGVAYGTSHTISGVVSGCSNGVYYDTSHTISGVVSGCSSGVAYGTSHTISGVVSGCSSGVAYGTSHTISGVVSGCSSGVYSGTSHTMSGVVSGCSDGVNSGTSHTISGVVSGCNNGVVYGTSHTVSGVVSGCGNGVAYGTSHTISGVVSGCSSGVAYGTAFILNASFSGNTYDIFEAVAECYGAYLGSATQVYRVNQTYHPYNGANPFGVVSYDQQSSVGVYQKGAHRAWNQGGTITPAAYVEGTHGSMPTGWEGPDPDYVLDADCDSTATPIGATDPVLWFDLPAMQGVDGETVAFQCAIKLTQTSNWTSRPTLQLIDLRYPWLHGSQVLDSEQAASNTDWQLLTVSVDAAADQQLAIRVVGQQVAGNSNSWMMALRQIFKYPTEAQVENAVAFGHEYTGSYVGGGGGGGMVIVGRGGLAG